MEENKIKSIDHLTNELHDSVTELYEELMGEDDKESVRVIDTLILQLRDLKNNIVNKDE